MHCIAVLPCDKEDKRSPTKIFMQGCHCYLGNVKYFICKVYLRGFKVLFNLKIHCIMCNVAEIMHSTAVSTQSATDSMQVAAEKLPKTYFGFFKGE